ncbi:hypothetical protein DFH05DRAFT_1457774 [Lentinula detonsa]|uniref:Uncharacterized protein n=1 Tax=Lentinula detonsa TaxID=2804962 RepID=A0A9W8P5J4_9AGAR|nr:hypothetical protein DFH05DRAFT_1457774 [Lentinula detonsa]
MPRTGYEKVSKPLPISKKALIPRFDTVIVLDTDEAESTAVQERVDRGGFLVPASSQWPRDPLAYVTWFTRFKTSPDHNTLMYRVEPAKDSKGQAQGSIIPLTDIRQSCMLTPGRTTWDKTWNTESILDKCDSLFVNNLQSNLNSSHIESSQSSNMKSLDTWPRKRASSVSLQANKRSKLDARQVLNDFTFKASTHPSTAKSQADVKQKSKENVLSLSREIEDDTDVSGYMPMLVQSAPAAQPKKANNVKDRKGRQHDKVSSPEEVSQSEEDSESKEGDESEENNDDKKDNAGSKGESKEDNSVGIVSLFYPIRFLKAVYPSSWSKMHQQGSVQVKKEQREWW